MSDRMSRMLTGTSAPAWRGATGGELTLGTVLARPEERAREIAAQAEGDPREDRGADRAAGRARHGRRGNPDHPQDAAGAADPQSPASQAPKLPDHPAYQEIMVVFTAADSPLPARAACEAMDVQIAPDHVNNVRLKLKRLAERGILIETEQGLFTRPRP
ncbi:hypothetical protein ACIBJF_30550 [Streptomyces sp. NPDC050743]|uniref:hypothetical protein n=1 Tax=Streptomyces sp. NPDC050743 TaxID=3365634 RepID=UPI00378B8852